MIGLREVQAGDTVGYNGIFTAQRPMRLALLPVGYADGLRRELSGSNARPGGWTMVQGRRAAIVGRVSMNLTVVDVTEIPGVAVGDEVVVLGDGVTADDHARLAHTIAYEIVCEVWPARPRGWFDFPAAFARRALRPLTSGLEKREARNTSWNRSTQCAAPKTSRSICLEFVASQAHVGTKSAGSTGFGVAAFREARPPGDGPARALCPLPSGGRGAGRKEVVPAPDPLRVAVVGAGAFGRNHLRVYRELEQAGQAVQLVAVVDRDPAVAAEASQKFGVPGFESIEACLAAAGRLMPRRSVCLRCIMRWLRSRCWLRVSIFWSRSRWPRVLPMPNRILELARKHGCIVQAGHLERFNPAVTAARQHLHEPMYPESHRLSVFTPRSLDVDVVLDLMIHDLDIVLSLVASPVREVRAVGLPVLSRKVDIANVRLEFENGCVANFTASRVSTERVRKLRFFQPHQYLSLDFARQDLLMIDVTAAEATYRAALPSLLRLPRWRGSTLRPGCR